MKRVELPEGVAKELLWANARAAYRIARLYTGAVHLAYSSSTSEIMVSGGSEHDPTAEIALDHRRAVIRRALPDIAARIVLAHAALAQAEASLKSLDTMPGEQLGRLGSWTTTTAMQAEVRVRRFRRVNSSIRAGRDGQRGP